MAKETIGSNIPPYISNQIKNREVLFNSYSKKELLPLRLEVMNSSTGWVRLSSGVNRLDKSATQVSSQEIPSFVEFSKGRDEVDGFGINLLEAKRLYTQLYIEKNHVLPSNSDLSSNYVLSSGTNQVGNRPPRQGMNWKTISSPDKAYNMSEDLGMRPMPGITSVKIASRNIYGTLQQADISFNVWTREELDVCELIYFRPGYTALLEWGHTAFVGNETPLKGYSAQSYPYRDVQGAFFSPENSKEVENLIELNRNQTGGNYDAIFGFITNFSWKFRPDGGYDCTVKLISKGIVLESLKINAASLGHEIKGEGMQEKQRSIFHRIFTILENTKQPETVSGKELIRKSFSIDSRVSSILESLSDFPQLSTQGTFISGEEEDLKTNRIAYLPLRTFLELVNATVLLKGGASPQSVENIISIRTQNGTDFLTFAEHFSIDPLTALPPFPPSGKDPIPFFTIKGLHTLMKQYADGNGGQTEILNIMVSTVFLRKEIDRILDSTEDSPTTVYDMLTSVMKGVQQALGNINNFEVLYQETPYPDKGYASEYVITDRNAIYLEDKQGIPELKITGIGSTVLDLQVESKISNEISSQVAIAAQGSTGNYRENLEALLRWNMGAVDRHFPVKRTVKEPENKEEGNPNLYKTLQNLWNQFNSVSDSSSTGSGAAGRFVAQARESGLSIGSTEKTGWGDVSGAGCEELMNLYRKRLAETGSTPPSAIPVEMSMKMVGIAGFKIGTLFRVSGDIFPSSYKNFGFLITGVEHDIENSQKWTTTVKTQYFPLPAMGGAKERLKTSAQDLDLTPSVSNTPKLQTDTPNANRLRKWVKENMEGRVDEKGGIGLTTRTVGGKSEIADISVEMANQAIAFLTQVLPVLKAKNLRLQFTSGGRLSPIGKALDSKHLEGNAVDFVVSPTTEFSIPIIEREIQKFILLPRSISVSTSYLNEYYQDKSLGRNCFHLSIFVGREGNYNAFKAKQIKNLPSGWNSPLTRIPSREDRSRKGWKVDTDIGWELPNGKNVGKSVKTILTEK